MTTIQMTKAEIHLSESTVCELVEAIKEASTMQGDKPYACSPLPDYDLTEADKIKEQRNRGLITVRANHSGVIYKINLGGSGIHSSDYGCENTLYELVV